MTKKKKPLRDKIPVNISVAVLTESGYRCAVPTCRQILALDIHHMVEVSEGGKNEVSNLLPLCPTCHALYHRNKIRKESIYVWKSIIVSLTCAFDVEAVDKLSFLDNEESDKLLISGDGVVKFSRLIASGLVSYTLDRENGPIVLYRLALTDRGKQVINAWKSGSVQAYEEAYSE